METEKCCGNCAYFNDEDAFGMGCCDLKEEIQLVSNDCCGDYLNNDDYEND